ncbi:MAG TPA: Rieske 2Fe-2S domain-containing protein [Limnochordales bacterium]|nr:Rieske 2Fe-2S domain-containing protein [Limnochordales bacterium]
MAEAEGKEQQQAAKDQQAMSRRGLLRNVMWASAGLFAVQAAVTGLAMFWPRKVEGFGTVIDAGPIENYPVGTVTRIRDGRFYISRLPEGVIALYWRCPHLGCTVPWVDAQGLFICPCHGSVYEPTGQNIAGPAPRPMDYMRVEIRGGRLLVDTGDIRERDRHRPDHVTPV